MPKHKSKKEESDSDSGPEDVSISYCFFNCFNITYMQRGPIKKAKPDKKAEKSSGDENGYSLGKMRFVNLSEFKGKWYVNIREYYNADGELKPGKKGIMLTMEQWQKLKEHISDVDEDIKKNV